MTLILLAAEIYILKSVTDMFYQQYSLRRNKGSHDYENHCGYLINQPKHDFTQVPFLWNLFKPKT